MDRALRPTHFIICNNCFDKCKATGYSLPMKIRSIADKGLKRLYEDGNAKGVAAGTVDKLRKMFAFLDTMHDAEREICDMDLEDYH
jgi:hypothetical protein